MQEGRQEEGEEDTSVADDGAYEGDDEAYEEHAEEGENPKTHRKWRKGRAAEEGENGDGPDHEKFEREDGIDLLAAGAGEGFEPAVEQGGG